ncbi:MAG: hypothetical protein LBQ93_10225 [Treponema sp.]|nr:hypothetical protein [Treponema sp.]
MRSCVGQIETIIVSGRAADDDRFVLQAEKRMAARNHFCIRSRGTASARMAEAKKNYGG